MWPIHLINIHKLYSTHKSWSLSHALFMKAWLCSRAYNRLLGQFGHAPCFHYLISGGDESLIISNELPEDDPPQGIIIITGATQTLVFLHKNFVNVFLQELRI